MGLHAPILTLGEHALIERLPDSASGKAARAMLLASGLPTKRIEAFKWSDLRAALGDAIPNASGSASLIPACLQHALVIDFAAEGFGIEGEKGDGLVIETEDSLPVDQAGPMAVLAAALAPRAIVLRVTKPQASPVVLRRHPGAPMRVRIELEPFSSLTLVELAQSEAGLSTCLVEADIAQGAQLTRICVQAGGAGTVDLSQGSVFVDQSGRYQATLLAFGGRFARQETHITLAGAEAVCNLAGAYLLAGRKHADVTVKVTHAAPGGNTRELFKGAARDQSRAVFQGKILVERAAQETDARQNHHALLLSEGAEIDAKPELEIYADNVQCAHGNTIGALDEQALFYMRQRGIPLEEARALLVQAFVGEVFDSVTDEGIRNWLQNQAALWLAGAES